MAKESQKGAALKPLPVERLCSICDPAQFPFATTAELDDQLDIAGQDLADPEDMKTAMRLAVELARQKTLGQPVN